ncbi:MAG TPA: transcription antitermination factor NusB [Tepidisphaeraceae bacterium]|nr:transcription antitermination factor NusB [Tepidisphaeraceae bacterium]
MSSKRKARELALQLLFAWDAHGSADTQMTQQIVQDATDDVHLQQASIEMAEGAWKNHEPADQWIERLAPQWPPRRQPGVDRAILRLAVWELTHHDTPPKVVIDEAIELAKAYSTENSPSFVNGVLDTVLREHLKEKPQ